MRSEVTGVVRLEQPQYQSAELLIAVLARGFRVVEVPGHDPQAPGRREQEGPQRDLRPALRRRGRRHLVAGAAAPDPGRPVPAPAAAPEPSANGAAPASPGAAGDPAH